MISASDVMNRVIRMLLDTDIHISNEAEPQEILGHLKNLKLVDPKTEIFCVLAGDFENGFTAYGPLHRRDARDLAEVENPNAQINTVLELMVED